MASSESTPEQRQKLRSDYTKFLHTSTLAGCVLAPILIALPPRKLDLYTFTLTGALLLSANYQVRERTGLGIVGHASRSLVPPRRDTQKEASAFPGDGTRLLEESPSQIGLQRRSILEGKAKQAWMQRAEGSEGWKEQRMKEEQEKLDQGEGYGSMIADQIWEVWNQGEKKMDEVKQKDQDIVRERKLG